MKNWISYLGILLVIFATGIFAGCTGGGDTEAPQDEVTPPTDAAPVEKPMMVKIGLVAPLTGGASSTGNDMWEAAELAAEEINGMGGVNIGGKMAKIELVKVDTETKPEKGKEAVTRAITVDKVNLLVGGFSSGITFADSVPAAEEGLPFVITGASSPIITHREDVDTSSLFHHCPTTDDFSFATMLFANDVLRPAVNEKFGYSEDRKLKVALIYRDDPYGKGVKEGVAKAISENPEWMMEIVAEEPYAPGTSNFQTVLTTVQAQKPDCVYPATFINEQVPLVTQARQVVGLNTIFFAVEATDDVDYYDQVGDWGEYSIQETRFSPYTVPAGEMEGPVNKFRNDFKAKFGSFPSMMGASTYEGMYIAKAALENAGSTDKTAVVAALNALDMPQMVETMDGGRIAFSEDFRETKFMLYMQQLMKDGEGNVRPVIVWPENIKQQDFVLPDWYESEE